MARLSIVLVALVAAVSGGSEAVACEARGGPSGPQLVFVLHGEAGESHVQAATAAIAASPMGAVGLRTFVARVPAAACERVTKDSLVPFLRCGPAVNDAVGGCASAGAKIVVLSSLAFTSRASVVHPLETAGVFVSMAVPVTDWTRDLLHELGHAFGLRDERPILTSRAKGVAATPGPNCAATADEARRRWGDLAEKGEAGFHAGCAGNAGWLRPHARTLMDSPRTTPAWGAVNERYLRAALRCCFTSERDGCAAAAARDPELARCLPARVDGAK